MIQRLLLGVFITGLTVFFWGSAFAQEVDAVPATSTEPCEGPDETCGNPLSPSSNTAESKEPRSVQLLRSEVAALSQWVTTTRLASQKNKVERAGEEQKKFKFSAYMRSRYGAILQSDTNPDFVGRNDGFRLDNARLQVDLKSKAFTGRLSIDGAVDQRDADNTSNGHLELGLRDAWVAWSPFKSLRFGTGQFKPAFDGEELRSTKKMTFIERSVTSRGIRGVEGWNVAGMSLTRELGLFLEYKTPKVSDLYLVSTLSLTNGSPASRSVNDNETLALTGRMALKWGKRLTTGFGYRHNRLTTGEAPDRLTDEVAAWVADLHLRQPIGPVVLLGSAQYMTRTVHSVDVPNEPETVGEGYYGSFGLRFLDAVELAYRYATLDPTSEFVADDPAAEAALDADGVIHHTVGLSYAPDPKKTPVKIQVNYTATIEDEGRSMDNDRLDVLLQVHFDERG